jgi:hypothetical protein
MTSRHDGDVYNLTSGATCRHVVTVKHSIGFSPSRAIQPALRPISLLAPIQGGRAVAAHTVGIIDPLEPPHMLGDWPKGSPLVGPGPRRATGSRSYRLGNCWNRRIFTVPAGSAKVP